MIFLCQDDGSDGFAHKQYLVKRTEMVHTKTFNNYIDAQLWRFVILIWRRRKHHWPNTQRYLDVKNIVKQIHKLYLN